MQLIKPSWLSHSGEDPQLANTRPIPRILIFWLDATGEQKDFEVYSCHVSPDGSRLATAGGGMRAPSFFLYLPLRDTILTLHRWPCPSVVHRVDIPVRRSLLLEAAPTLPYEPPPWHNSLRPLLSQRSLSRVRRRRQDNLHIPSRHQPSLTCRYVWYARLDQLVHFGPGADMGFA